MKNKSKHNTEDEDTEAPGADHSDSDIKTYAGEYTPERQSSRQGGLHPRAVGKFYSNSLFLYHIKLVV